MLALLVICSSARYNYILFVFTKNMIDINFSNTISISKLIALMFIYTCTYV